ncbi:hypothetical protein AMECASPLE_009396 [Ameca splendens]|uniref:Uncharacterized protein n=1 Tax=Ameca splendens TaxID=208324 RepID=A0ABV0YND2_9TELE
MRRKPLFPAVKHTNSCGFDTRNALPFTSFKVILLIKESKKSLKYLTLTIEKTTAVCQSGRGYLGHFQSDVHHSAENNFIDKILNESCHSSHKLDLRLCRPNAWFTRPISAPIFPFRHAPIIVMALKITL